MATAAQQAAAELRRVQAYLESQGSLLGGEALQQQAAVWQSKLRSTQIGPDEALLLVETIGWPMDRRAAAWAGHVGQLSGAAIHNSSKPSSSPAGDLRFFQIFEFQ